VVQGLERTVRTSPDCLRKLHNRHFEYCSVITFVVDVAAAAVAVVVVMVPLDGADY
jgi:hypothetical protein